MSASKPADRRSVGSVLFALFCVVIVLLGAALSYQGGQLVAVGGSFYYLAMGIALIVAGVLLLTKRRSGLWLFGLASLATWIWDIWE